MAKIDFKKLYPDLYLPKTTPSVLTVPPLPFIMIDGSGNPNLPEGQYQSALGVLYSLSFTIKMAPKGGHQLAGYTDYTVPPLEGLWWLPDGQLDFSQKERFCWTAMIRQPDFVTPEIFSWAVEQVRRKKPNLPVEKAQFLRFDEGLCVQCMHRGPYDSEPATLEKLWAFIEAQGFQSAIGQASPGGLLRQHHEIYLSDPRRAKPENNRTVLRIPVSRK